MMKILNPLSKVALASAAAWLLMSSAATAQSTILETHTFTGLNPGNYNTGFTPFDTSLGTLTSVTITLTTFSSGGTSTGTNTSSYPVMFGGSGTAGYVEDITAGYHNVFNITNNLVSGNVTTLTITAPPVDLGNVNPGDSVTSPPLTASQGSDVVVNPTDLLDYESGHNPSFTLDLTAATATDVSGNAGTNAVYVAGSASATATGEVEIQYTYTPVPEPAETAGYMMAFGLLLLGLRMQRTRLA